MSITHRFGVAAAALCILLGGLPADAQDSVIAKVNGKTITEADMKLAEAEIGSDLGSLPEPTKRRVLVEFLIENQLFADAAEGQNLGSGQRSRNACSTGAGAHCAMPTSTPPSGTPSTRPKPGNSTRAWSGRPNPRRRSAPATFSSRARTRPASCSRSWRTAPTLPNSPRSIPKTRARRTRAANWASSRADRWCRNSRRPPSSSGRARSASPSKVSSAGTSCASMSAASAPRLASRRSRTGWWRT